MKKIAIATATRAEYGILHPLLVRLMEEKEFDVQLLVTGTHLEEQFGYTVKEIEKDGIPIARKIPILAEDNSPYGISVTMAQAITGFADYFRNGRPDLFLVLGDRTEILGMCAAALNEHIPIAHLHGGELTEGAVDDCIRHAVTKMSYLHFPATEVYRRRIIQMGEAPERVYNVGALGVENILSVPMLSEEEIRKDVEIPAGMPYAVVTFHPVTMQPGEAEQQVRELIAAMREEKQYFYLVTKANADAGGRQVNAWLAEAQRELTNMKLVSSLGMKRYLSAVKYAAFVLGNSSSGIIEAPALGTPTVNIGDRQKGRLMAETVIGCMPETGAIQAAIRQTEQMPHRPSFLYGDGKTSQKIVKILKEFFHTDYRHWKKTFYDMECK